MGVLPALFPVRLDVSDVGQRLYEMLEPYFREDENYAFAGLKLCQGISAMLDPISLIAQPLGEKPPFALLFDPENIPAVWLPWCAQFVGSDLKTAKTEATKRDWIKNPINWQRGTSGAIISAASQTLTGTKAIYFYPRFTGPFSLKIAVNETECASEKETRLAIESVLPAWMGLEL